MWHITEPPRQPTPDLPQFLKTLHTYAAFFDGRRELVLARAPGRLDVMGGIADYSGSLVLELPLGLATFAAVQFDDSPTVTMRSTAALDADSATEVRLPLAELAPGGVPLDYAAARAYFAANPRQHWAAYVAGALVSLGQERGMRFSHGLRILIDSAVPPGKGVSSSAALEVATTQAILALHGETMNGRELALLCQRTENLVVGAPCGVMDQMTVACGEQGQLLALLCQPAELLPGVSLPAELEVWGIDSGIRHAVSGADYGSVRVGAFMGYRIMQGLAGAGELPDGGYLANVAPSLWETRYRDRVPDALDGAAFLARYSGTHDSVTTVDPNRRYQVRQPTAHPVFEHQRVQLFRALLPQAASDETVRQLLGELMFQSHASYSACGLGSHGTDMLVELVRAAGPAAGFYGAKITGGGSGGTVAILARRGSAAAVAALAQRYRHETGHESSVIGGSSPGALAFGVARLAWG